MAERWEQIHQGFVLASSPDETKWWVQGIFGQRIIIAFLLVEDSQYQATLSCNNLQAQLTIEYLKGHIDFSNFIKSYRELANTEPI
jgi:hypothetical protein